uniref:leucine-rich repeat protein n=1 Tax=Aquimarina pacifica TaxID=1296415 RepID=UPI000471D9DB
VDGIEYTITSLTNPTTVEVSDYVGTSNAVVIPNTVTNNNIIYTVTTIGDAAFRDNNLISVTIPDSVTTIGDFAFANNELTSVISESLDPATLFSTIFDDRSVIDLSIPIGTTEVYQMAGWTGFNTVLFFDETFIVDGIEYTITSLTNPTTVEVSDYTGISTTVSIPTTVTYGSISFTITSIGTAAFRDNELTSVTIPDSVTTISDFAFWGNKLTSIIISDSVETIGFSTFRNNELTSITIPDSVTSIGDYAFFGNELTSVISESLDPATLLSNVFDDRSVIDLSIPASTIEAYQTAGWTGFNFVTEDNVLSGTENTPLENLIFTSTTNTIVILTTGAIRLENISLYNMSGQQILISKQAEVSINHLASGTYVAKLTTNLGTVAKKFAK